MAVWLSEIKILLESAINRPFQVFEGVELYKSVYEKGSALLESIIKNHPFIDGNKRTALLVLFALFKRNEIRLIASEEEMYNLIVNIATSEISFNEIVKNLQQYSIGL